MTACLTTQPLPWAMLLFLIVILCVPWKQTKFILVSAPHLFPQKQFSSFSLSLILELQSRIFLILKVVLYFCIVITGGLLIHHWAWRGLGAPRPESLFHEWLLLTLVWTYRAHIKSNCFWSWSAYFDINYVPTKYFMLQLQTLRSTNMKTAL